MEITEINALLREGIFIVLKIGGPMLFLSMIVGVLLSIFQAVTQVHEQTLSFLFKLAVVGSCLLIGGEAMLDILITYTESIFEMMRR